MNLSPLTANSPLDGRYRTQLEDLSKYFSELALFRYRVMVEIEYFIALCTLDLPQLKEFNNSLYSKLRAIYEDFEEKDAEKIKLIEQKINHDVKAVEYFIKEKFEELNIAEYKELIHFGLTSQDINNTATPRLLKDSINDIYLPLLKELTTKLDALSNDWKDIPMLARTHGQPASPTRLGKEIKVFVERISNQQELLNTIPFSAKFGGATGNFNAHNVTYPDVDWIKFANDFLETQLGLKRLQNTTQIEHYDNMAAIFDNLKRINNILVDLARDIWTYIAMDYFKQKVNKEEVGSSAMPHKVNPIDFENAEGNLGLANAIFEHLSSKLPISRLQRDLTDSTVLRNIGVPMGHTVLAIKSLLKGLDKLILNEQKIKEDLDNNWAVVAEAIQSILRRENYPNPYEALKELTRNNEKITQETLATFIANLNIGEDIKEDLLQITPFNYTGK